MQHQIKLVMGTQKVPGQEPLLLVHRTHIKRGELLSRTHLLRAPPLFSLVGRRKHARLTGMQHPAAGEPPPPQSPPDGARGVQGGAPRCRSMGSARELAPPCRRRRGEGTEASETRSECLPLLRGGCESSPSGSGALGMPMMVKGIECTFVFFWEQHTAHTVCHSPQVTKLC
jgi:hypothetical protein